MTTLGIVPKTVRLGFSMALISVCLLMGCSQSDSNQVQGYVEGEFVYIASPLPGALQTLHVQRGMQVKADDLLFTLDHTPEQAARDEAERRRAQARANLEDAKKGRRPSEIDAIEAQLKQARAALSLAEREYTRQESLTQTPGATAELEFLRSRSARDQARQRVAQLSADLKTAQLGSRSDQIAAAEANLRAVEAALVKAEWDLSQKRQTAPQAALVFDTFYREGEWVPAGRPVVALLPPRNIKVRAFVPETMVGTIHPGVHVQVSVDGVGEPFLGTVSYISPKAEYTPPVIYSQDSRTKLVFMIEAVFDSDTSVNLHPGQPVDVHLGL
jgi:HlyD family secretion protein